MIGTFLSVGPVFYELTVINRIDDVPSWQFGKNTKKNGDRGVALEERERKRHASL
jgi:hypothetical protein